eukprot:scaffold5075_cov109-Isochrysis_galbana.AAC.3
MRAVGRSVGQNISFQLASPALESFWIAERMLSSSASAYALSPMRIKAASASLSRPRMASQRGLSGTVQIRMESKTAGTMPIANMKRQPPATP